MPQQLCIAIDARYLSHGLVGGVRTYLRNLIGGVARVGPHHSYVLWADRKAPFEVSDLPANMTTQFLPWAGAMSSVRNDTQIGTAMLRDGADVAHFPANYGRAPDWLPSVVTIHDAINLLPLRKILAGHPKQARTALMMSYLHLMTTRSARRQPFVITVSEYSRNEILKRARLDPERVRVVYSAPESCFRPLAVDVVEAARRRLGLRDRVLLADAIKNPYATLRAWRALPDHARRTASLVFFARRPPVPAVQDAARDGVCRLLLQPDQEDLVALYNLADAFIFPSWYEGFGLPTLEAMACGTPVIASSRGSLPEIVGDAGIIVDAEDHAAIAGAAQELLAGQRYADAMRAASRARAARFSWDVTARQTIEVYELAQSEGARQPVVPFASVA